jgi:dihydroorotate dehydrogenase (fumarate)
LLYGNIAADICSCSGIMNGDDGIKMLLAGATCFEVVSTIYQNGIGHIPKMLKEIEEWMDHKGYKSIEDFRGKLAKKNLKDPFAYRRAQYVEILMRNNDILQKSKLV